MSDQPILLLVDRDERSIQTFRATLEVERRVRLVVAPNGEDALRMSRDIRPDLIVIAHDIQRMNVFSFCQALRQDPEFESTMLVLEIERTLGGRGSVGCKPGCAPRAQRGGPEQKDEDSNRSFHRYNR